MNKQDEILTVSPEQTYHAIRGSIVTAQHSVAKAVNSAMVTAYWEIGEQIYKACGENDRAEYGIRLLEYLSAKLTAEFGKGFSVQELRNMRQFYCTFPIRSTLWSELSWSHYRLLMRVSDEKAPHSMRRSVPNRPGVCVSWSARSTPCITSGSWQPGQGVRRCGDSAQRTQA